MLVRRAVSTGLLALGAAAACGGETAPSRPTRFISPGALLYEAPGPDSTIELQKASRIVLVGDLVGVVDRFAGRVHFFRQSDGVYARSVGGPIGSGPSEFKMLSGAVP